MTNRSNPSTSPLSPHTLPFLYDVVASFTFLGYSRSLIVHYAVVASCYTPGRPGTERVRRVFRSGCVTFAEYFTEKRASSIHHCWCRKTRVIAISYGIKISAVHHLVSSQHTHLSDVRTELREHYRALHYVQSRGKNVKRCSVDQTL